ncbi:MAG TPA: 50S ribosomal protein L21 [Pirellulales bacterium]
MYAIIKTDGKQYRVEEGQLVALDYRDAQKVGDVIEFTDVLAIGKDGSSQIGAPLLSGALVKAEVTKTVQGPKLVVQKFRRRKNLRRRTGHRQWYTEVKISSIAGPA